MDPASTDSYNEILEKLYEIVTPFIEEGVDIELKEDTELGPELGLDSLKVMKLLLIVEDTFDVSIPLNILPDIRTIKDFAHQLEELLQENE